MPSKKSKSRIFQGKLWAHYSSDLDQGISLLTQKLEVSEKHFLLDLEYTPSSRPLNKDTIQEVNACFFYIELPNHPNATKEHKKTIEYLLSQWRTLEEKEVSINKNHNPVDDHILIPYKNIAEPLYGVTHTPEYTTSLQT